MPDLWDTNPDNVFRPPGRHPNPGPSGHHDHDEHPEEMPLKDHRGHLRPPAYVLIAVVIALAASTLAIVVALGASS
jgi:hypothetical protein